LVGIAILDHKQVARARDQNQGAGRLLLLFHDPPRTTRGRIRSALRRVRRQVMIPQPNLLRKCAPLRVLHEVFRAHCDAEKVDSAFPLEI
jgi:hypothetical protein